MRRATIAAFLNQKGGVGKTTSVVNVGAGLSIMGKRVLIVDLDPQGHLTTFLGIEPRESDPTVYDVLRGKALLSAAVQKQDLGAMIAVDEQESRLAMSVVPADHDLLEAEGTLTFASERELLLRNAIRRVENEYDYILIDCPPSLGLLSTNALAAASKVFIPVQTEFLALESLESLMTWIERVMEKHNPDLQIGGLIATRFDGRKVINRSVVENLKERFGVFLLHTMVRENIALAESPEQGKDIFTYRSRSRGAEDYMNLCLEILDQDASTSGVVETRFVG